MTENPRKRKLLTKEEKKKITEKMIKGYKKMAVLNLELAEDRVKSNDETRLI